MSLLRAAQTYVVVSKRDGKEINRIERTYDDFVTLQQTLKVRRARTRTHMCCVDGG